MISWDFSIRAASVPAPKIQPIETITRSLLQALDLSERSNQVLTFCHIHVSPVLLLQKPAAEERNAPQPLQHLLYTTVLIRVLWEMSDFYQAADFYCVTSTNSSERCNAERTNWLNNQRKLNSNNSLIVEVVYPALVSDFHIWIHF